MEVFSHAFFTRFSDPGNFHCRFRSAFPQDGPFQIGYAANLNIGDSVVNLSNDGLNGGVFGAGTTGNICVNTYVFDPQEEEIGCCACLVTPNGLNSLSVKADLISNNLTPAVPTSVVIKLLASRPTRCYRRSVDGLQSAILATAGAAGAIIESIVFGMLAWGTTLNQVPPLELTTPFQRSFPQWEPGCPRRWSSTAGSEVAGLTALCNFIQANGTGFGICKSCRLGALGGAKQ